MRCELILIALIIFGLRAASADQLATVVSAAFDFQETEIIPSYERIYIQHDTWPLGVMFLPYSYEAVGLEVPFPTNLMMPWRRFDESLTLYLYCYPDAGPIYGSEFMDGPPGEYFFDNGEAQNVAIRVERLLPVSNDPTIPGEVPIYVRATWTVDRFERVDIAASSAGEFNWHTRIGLTGRYYIAVPEPNFVFPIAALVLAGYRFRRR